MNFDLREHHKVMVVTDGSSTCIDIDSSSPFVCYSFMMFYMLLLHYMGDMGNSYFGLPCGRALTSVCAVLGIRLEPK